MRKSLLALVALVLFVSGGFALTAWHPSSYADGLLADDYDYDIPSPAVAYNLTGDGNWTMIYGNWGDNSSDGYFNASYWNGTNWKMDNSRVSGLGSIGDGSYPRLGFNVTGNNKWDMIAASMGSGSKWHGFYWNGTGWTEDTSMVNGITSSGGYYGMPELIFNITGDDKWWAIMGAWRNYPDPATPPVGYYWNGTGWTKDSTIITGFAPSDRSHSSVFHTDEGWLMVDTEGGYYYGYRWNGTGWEHDNSLVRKLSYGHAKSMDVHFNITGRGLFDMIFGGVYGTFHGYTQNVPPTISTVHIIPDPAYTTDTLTCAGTYSDADGDPETGSTYRWFKNGALIAGQTGKTLSSDQFSHFDNILCEYTPNDGYDYGTPVNSTILTISNTPPTITNVHITPDPANVLSTLTCNGDYSDIDGDPETGSTYQWFRNGNTIAGQTSKSLDSGYFVKDDNITCEYTPNDGYSLVTMSMTSPSGVVEGTWCGGGKQVIEAPVEMYFGTGEHFSGTNATLTLSVLQASVGVYINGTSLPDANEYTTSLPFTIASTSSPIMFNVTKDESYEYAQICDANTAHPPRIQILDNALNPITSDKLTISNTAPSVANVSVKPDAIDQFTNVTCNGTYSDIDNDPETGSTYRWWVNNALVPVTTKLLDQSHFTTNDFIQCEYTPYDGDDYGTPLNSSTVQVTGKLPSNLEEDVPDSVNVGTPFTVHAFYTDNGNNPIRDGVSCEVSYENNTDSMSWNEDLNDWEAEITLSQQGAVDIQADCTSTDYEDASDVVTVGVTPYSQQGLGPSAAIPKPITALVTQSTIYGTVASSEFVMAFPGLTIAVTIFNMIGGLI